MHLLAAHSAGPLSLQRWKKRVGWKWSCSVCAIVSLPPSLVYLLAVSLSGYSAAIKTIYITVHKVQKLIATVSFIPFLRRKRTSLLDTMFTSSLPRDIRESFPNKTSVLGFCHCACRGFFIFLPWEIVCIHSFWPHRFLSTTQTVC